MTTIRIAQMIPDTEAEGPGPLVSLLAGKAGHFPVPIVIVPGHLDDQGIDALS